MRNLPVDLVTSVASFVQSHRCFCAVCWQWYRAWHHRFVKFSPEASNLSPVDLLTALAEGLPVLSSAESVRIEVPAQALPELLKLLPGQVPLSHAAVSRLDLGSGKERRALASLRLRQSLSELKLDFQLAMSRSRPPPLLLPIQLLQLST